MPQIIYGRSHGKRDRDGYVCTHGICATCRGVIWKLWIGNAAGWSYAAPMVKRAISEHRCEAVAA